MILVMVHETNRRKFIATAGIVGSAGMAGCFGGDSPEDDGSTDTDTDNNEPTDVAISEQTFSVSSILPESHFISQNNHQLFFEKVEEMTGGKVTFDVTYGGQLGGAGDQSRLAERNTADIATIAPVYESEKFPLSDISALPTYSTAEAGSRALNTVLWDELNEAEFDPRGLQPILGHTISPYNIMHSNKRIEAMEDWNGEVIRTGGGQLSRNIEALGASPTAMPGGETYQALQRGTIDGVAITLTSADTYDLWEGLSTCSTNAVLGGSGFTVAMNADVWSSLSTELQDVIQSASQEAAVEGGQAHDAAKQDIATSVEQVEFYEVSDQNLSDWATALESVIDNWVERLSDQGKPAQAALDAWNEAL